MIGCLCIHGFTGNRWEVEPLAKELATLNDWLVYTPLLPGHGENIKQLKGITYEEWVYTVEVAIEELQKRCSTLYVIGFSMGGMLASYIAARYPVDKLVLLNAAAHYVNPRQMIKDVMRQLYSQITGTKEEDLLADLYEQKFKETPLAALKQFIRLVEKTRPYVRKVNVPTLIIQGERDGLVPLKSAHYLYDTIQTNEKKLLIMKQSRHMICYGTETDEVIAEVTQFLTERLLEKEKNNMKVVAPKPFTFEGGQRAVLLLHGFTGTTADVRMLGRYLQKEGYTCHAPLYRGHGVPPEELVTYGPDDWWADVEAAYEHLRAEGYEEIAVCGLSLGGVFTLKLSYSKPVKGIVSMCAPVRPRTEDAIKNGFLAYSKEYKQLERKEQSEIENELQELEQTSMDSLFKLRGLMNDVRKELDLIYAPAFIVQARHDEMIDTESANIIYDEIETDEKELKWYEHSTHVITLGDEKEQLHRDILTFLNQLDWSN